MRSSIKYILVLLAVLFNISKAKANLTFCNETGLRAAVAVGWIRDGDWKSSGWWIIRPGQCTVVLSGSLSNNRFYYFYANTVGDALVWSGRSGGAPFCTAGERFSFGNANRFDCSHEIFRRIDTNLSEVHFERLIENRRTPLEAAQDCQQEVFRGRDAFASCWMRRQASVAQNQIFECFDSTENATTFSLCASGGNIDSETYRIASCADEYANGSGAAHFSRCLGGDRLTPEQARVLDCANAEMGSRIAACIGVERLTSDQARIVACAHNNPNSRWMMASCAFGQYMSAEQRRIFNCVARNIERNREPYMQIAACVGENYLTEEQRTLVRCAITSGGQPYVWAGCVGTQLTLNELNKCLERGIGGSGCFGQNNDAVRIIINAWRDITQGPGSGNDLLGRDGFTNRTLENARRDIQRGPGPSNDLFGEDGFVRRNLPPPPQIGGRRWCLPWC